MTQPEELFKPPDWLLIYLSDRSMESDHLIKWEMFRTDQLLAYNIMLNQIFNEELNILRSRYLTYKTKILHLYHKKKKIVSE